MDADSLLELTDYCYRKLVYLNTQGAEDAAYKERSGKAISEMLPEEDLQEKAAGMEFGVAVCSISILRYLTDYMGALPLSVMVSHVNTKHSNSLELECFPSYAG
uniref:Uncharacterized protein n=1 Tax=Physcomitrium patens TaxID=3218 RepID=A0A7I4AHZ4_PHYPA